MVAMNNGGEQKVVVKRGRDPNSIRTHRLRKEREHFLMTFQSSNMENTSAFQTSKFKPRRMQS